MEFALPDSLEDVNVNHAELELTIAPELSAYIENNFKLELSLITEAVFDTTDVLTTPVDSILTSLSSRYILPRPSATAGDEATLAFNGTSMNNIVQDWLSGYIDNFGLLIRSTKEAENIEYISFYSKESGVGLAPCLNIVYTRPISMTRKSSSRSVERRDK